MSTGRDVAARSVPGEGARCAAILLGALAGWLALAWPLLRGEVFTHDDLGWFHLPLRAFYARCLAAGQAFDWCPNLYAGCYLQGEGQLGMYHPMHLLLYRAMPLGVAFNLELLLSYPAGMLGTFLLLRRRGAPRDAALLGALTFSLAGFNLFHYMHINAVAVVAHLPWLLLAIGSMLGARTPAATARAGAAVALLTGSQLLLGYPQYVWISMMAEAAFALLAPGDRRRLGALAALSVAKLLGLGVGAVQILPTYEALAGSVRPAMTALDLGLLSLPPENLATALVPYLSRTRVVAPSFPVLDFVCDPASEVTDFRVKEFGLYAGVAVPTLLAWIAVRRRRLSGRRELVAALAIGVIGLVLALGQLTPLFDLTSRLPGFRSFRIPARHVVLMNLAGAAMVAVGFADLSRLAARGDRLPWRMLWPLAVPPALAALIVLSARLRPGSWDGVAIGTDAELGLSVGLVVGASLLVAAAARGHRRATTALAVLIAADLASFGASYVAETAERSTLAAVAEDHAPPSRSRSHRAIVTGEHTNDNRWIFTGRGTIHGYLGLAPARSLQYGGIQALRAGSVQWAVGSDGVTRLGIDALPWARLVSEARVSAEPAAEIESIDPAAVALVDRPMPLGGGPPGRVSVTRDEPGNLRIVTDAPTQQLLVLSERYHDGWRATVDGRPRRVFRVYGDFMGCLVEPGRHVVRLRFAPMSLTAGRAISLGSLALVLCWPIATQVARRRASGAASSASRASLLRGPHGPRRGRRRARSPLLPADRPPEGREGSA